jgi:hypothetical protein
VRPSRSRTSRSRTPYRSVDQRRALGREARNRTPLSSHALLGKRAEVLVPRVRDWMSTHSWVINEVVLVFFLALTISGLGSRPARHGYSAGGSGTGR